MSSYHNPTPYELVTRYGYVWADELNKGNYPIWDESKRAWLNEQLYEYFCYREIAQETGAEFFHWIRIKLYQVMPSINPVASLTLGENAAQAEWEVTGKQVTESESTGKGSTESNAERKDTGTDTLVDTSTQEGTSRSSVLDSTTPQVQLTTDENYMTGLSETGATSTGTSEQNSTQKTDGTSTTTGLETTNTSDTGTATTTSYNGQLTDRAAAWIENAPDILGIIYAALEPCFMQLWD